MKKKYRYTLFICCLFTLSSLGLLLVKNKSSVVHSENATSKSSTNSSTSIAATNTIDTLTTAIEEYITTNGIDANAIGISIYNFTTNERMDYNADVNFISASLYKVPLAMLYYEMLQDGQLQLSDTFLYEAQHYEEGGPIGYTYTVGTYITLEELLYDMIVYSDNTAGHILYENLGGWRAFKTQIQTYSDNILDEEALSYNVFSASFGNDVMSYIYEHRTIFDDLITHMKLVFPNDYLNKNLGITIAQKYGSYDVSENAMGIVYGSQDYSICITTSLGNNGIVVIGELNEIVYHYFNKNET